MIVVPEPIPLDQPPGNAEALREVVQDVARAAFHLTVLSGELAGRAASAPHWVGDDAAAATTQVAATATLARSSKDAVLTAMHRLSAHCDRLEEARRQVAALQREQDDDFRAAWARLRRFDDPRETVTNEAPEWVAAVEELRATEASRRRRHATVLEEVADDAAATARVLADCCAAVGGRGARGDESRVVAYLAARLPGWGDAELATRGRELADDLIGRSMRPEERQALAQRALPLAQEPAFATALIARLGVDGVAALLAALSYDEVATRTALARVLAAALGSAATTADGPDTVRRVLSATYVGPGDEGPSDDIASGMAAVLAVATPGRPGGVRLDTVATWGRQLLRRERMQGVLAGAGAVPSGGDPLEFDAARLVVDVLAAAGASGPAATLLGDRVAWDVLLARGWGDEGAALARVVQLAVTAPGAAGVEAVRAGLEALGTGLSDDGDPEKWTVDEETFAAVSGSLGTGLAAHVSVAIDVLAGADEPHEDEEPRDRLRGLAYLTVDRAAAAIVGRALDEWAGSQPLDLDDSSPFAPLSALAVPAGYLAVQEYGQRLAYNLRAFRLEDLAEDREFVWSALAYVPTHLPGWVGEALGLVDIAARRMLGNDGSWSIGPDRGLEFDREDAADEAIERVAGPTRRADATAMDEVARQSRAAFDRVSRALGSPQAPLPPGQQQLAESVLDEGADMGSAREGGDGRGRR